MDNYQDDDLGFSHKATKNGEIFIRRDGKKVTTLRGDTALEFLAELKGVSDIEYQQILARYTGNYKRGNERTAKNHPRNRDR
jgi:hypothetical protein